MYKQLLLEVLSDGHQTRSDASRPATAWLIQPPPGRFALPRDGYECRDWNSFSILVHLWWINWLCDCHALHADILLASVPLYAVVLLDWVCGFVLPWIWSNDGSLPSIIGSFIDSLIHSFIPSFRQSFLRSFIHSLISFCLHFFFTSFPLSFFPFSVLPFIWSGFFTCSVQNMLQRKFCQVCLFPLCLRYLISHSPSYHFLVL